ncbi:transporter substrate-binding domain-containing protein [Pelomonas sp. SE-A7]|uniref:substrate-binding periplasmic protein n=1 Tax=Pelomonas sp. SE-A7 TaxID=3054953 RepID=UPI00259C98DA|nr:transporter substrate-binding domain-containing protein [Pelomonas sp. SE-A7]MDM4765069.1 transporter substrate-binding domain-containing protein [Pelomonas sp. SE-A7]
MQRRTFSLALATSPGLLRAVPGPASTRVLVGDAAPYSYRRADGALQGAAVEILQLAATRLKREVRLELMPFARILHEAARPEPLLVMPPARLPAREDLLLWLAPMIDVRFMLFALADSKVDIASLDAARALKVGGLRSAGMVELIESAGFRKLEMVASNETALRMLKAGRVEALLTADHSVCHGLREMGMPYSAVREGALLQKVQLWLAASKALPEPELQAWRQAVEALRREGLVEPVLRRAGLLAG